MAKKSGLGRGLGALLDASGESKSLIVERKRPAGIGTIPLNKIEVNPFQPREDFDQESLDELADSIKIHGIIQPITVRQLSQNEFQLISGERRLQGSKLAGLTEVPAYIRTADDQQMLEMALIENIQRENLNAIEVALSYQRLLTECDLKQEELGDRVGKKRSTVTNYLRLLKLPGEIQAGLRDAKISMGHARTLVTMDDIDQQLRIFDQIVQHDLSVRKVEELVRNLGKEKPTSSPKKNSDPEILRLQVKLSSHFGTKIQVSADNENKGQIKIPFNSTDELNRILDILDV
ncbi:MAG: ParB/RepB/Spo0J family partition protein [Cytophagales bacterium]|nr:ParB/RepB/Spo0J family partition protein [Cytophagales bacterium]